MGEPCVVSHSTTTEKTRLLLLWGLGSLVRYPVYPAGEIEGGGFPKSEMRALEIPRTLFLAGRRNLSFLPWFLVASVVAKKEEEKWDGWKILEIRAASAQASSVAVGGGGAWRTEAGGPDLQHFLTATYMDAAIIASSFESEAKKHKWGESYPIQLSLAPSLILLHQSLSVTASDSHFQ